MREDKVKKENKSVTSLNTETVEKPKRLHKARNNFNQRYDKIKLSPETITVIKKALQSYKTSELEDERVKALSQLSQTDDYFIILYTARIDKKRDRSKHKYTPNDPEFNTQVNLFNETIKELNKKS
jgi:hypothetical protein